MPTLNLSGNKEKALQVKAMKVVGDIDKAFDLIKFNDSSGDLLNIYDPYTSGSTISISNYDDREKFKAVMAKYLKITNKPCINDDKNECWCGAAIEGMGFYLNNGTCVGFHLGNDTTVGYTFPDAGKCDKRAKGDAAVYIDVNGQDGPNQLGIDRFKMPINPNGIDYSCNYCNVNYCVECVMGNPNLCNRCYYTRKNPTSGSTMTFKLSDDKTTCTCTENCEE